MSVHFRHGPLTNSYNMTKSKKLTRYLTFSDIPFMALGGVSLGFIIPGLIYLTLGGLLEAPEGKICSTDSIFAGACSTIIGLLIIGLMALYWRFILKKHGVLFPALNGFGLIVALMTLFSGVMLSSELCAWIIYKS